MKRSLTWREENHSLREETNLRNIVGVNNAIDTYLEELGISPSEYVESALPSIYRFLSSDALKKICPYWSVSNQKYFDAYEEKGAYFLVIFPDIDDFEDCYLVTILGDGDYDIKDYKDRDISFEELADSHPGSIVSVKRHVIQNLILNK